jgi:flagellar hook protein FlgE
MSISSIMSSGLQNMQASINRTAIAGSGLNVENSDFAAKMVGMREGEIAVKAAGNVIKTADEILGTIIDIRG